MKKKIQVMGRFEVRAKFCGYGQSFYVWLRFLRLCAKFLGYVDIFEVMWKIFLLKFKILKFHDKTLNFDKNFGVM